ncbi:4092_t:CDS:2, partial [Racocetra fulgida]
MGNSNIKPRDVKDDFKHVQEIGEGGFSSVYCAVWIDGLRKLNSLDYDAKQTRSGPIDVALKTLTKSSNLSIEFLQELGKYFSIYGITYHPTTQEYMLVVEYADRGDLRTCLRVSRLDWTERLQILTDISYSLDSIHQAEYMHKDLHSEDEADGGEIQIHPEAVYTCRIMDFGNLNETG